jgi:regulator of sigma E protease
MLSVAAWFIATLVFVFGPIILIHELGHFVTARRSNVRVEEFGFGLPPRLLILAGGEGTLEVDSIKLTIPGRMWVPFDLEKGRQITVHAQKEGETLKITRMKLAKPDEGLSPGLEEQGTEVVLRGTVTGVDLATQYTLNLLPFGAFVRMTGEEDPSDPRSLAAQPRRQRLTVILGGSLANILGAFLILSAAYMIGSPEAFFARVDIVQEGSAAEAAEFQAGDIIVSIDDEPLTDGSWELRQRIAEAPHQTLDIAVIRDHETITLEATPSWSQGHGYLGVGIVDWPNPDGVERYSLPRAVAAASVDLATIVERMLSLPAMLIQGSVTATQARPASAVGINALLTFTLQQSIEWGIAFPTLSTAAAVSLVLGLTNLLPLPALDGGRALFIIIGAIRGRRINPETEGRIHLAAMLILLALMALVMVQDVFNPIIDWSMLRR